MELSRRQTLTLGAATGAVAIAGLCAEGPALASGAAALTAQEAFAIGKEAFLWGMHPVAIYHLRYNVAQNPASPTYAGLNRLFAYRDRMKALPRTVTTPNATTLYGFAMLDLASGPVVVTVPEIVGRYWSIQLYDNYGRWWHMIGNQFNAPGPVRRLVIGPDVDSGLPDGFAGTEIAQAPSDFSGLGVRIAITSDDADELAEVDGLLDRITVISLADWMAAGGGEVAPADVPERKADYPAYPGMETVAEPAQLEGLDFLRWVGLVLEDPTFTKKSDSASEQAAFARFARLGLTPGARFDPDALPPEIGEAAAAGVEDGRRDVLELLPEGIGIERNGWSFFSDLGYRDTDWRLRALNGLVAILAPVPHQSHVGVFGLKDSKGRRLSGAHRYTMTFRLDDLPPVTEFWEIPLYDSAGYFYDNPIDRYSLNSYMLARGELATADGKLVIHIQNEAPADPRERRNWLPAPPGEFQFAARFYGPKSPVIDASYDMPPVVRID